MKTQAWGWLVAGVLAAGLNASYHDGGLRWAHRLADCVEGRSVAVLALANGHVSQFLDEARMIATGDETARARWNGELARVESQVDGVQAMSARREAALDRLEARREQVRAQIEERIAAHRACEHSSAVMVHPFLSGSVRVPSINVTENQVSEIQVPEVSDLDVDVPQVHIPEIRVPAVSVSGISVPEIRVPEIRVRGINVSQVSVPTFCSHVHVRIPSMPKIRIPAAPVVHVEPSDAGPV